MRKFKLLNKSELERMTDEEALNVFKEMEEAMYDNMAETIRIGNDMYVMAASGDDTMLMKSVKLYFRQAYLLLDMYEHSFKECGVIIRITKEQRKELMHSVKRFKEILHRREHKTLGLLLRLKLGSVLRCVTEQTKTLGGTNYDITK